MIFSRWRPDTGGYDYFDSPSTRYGLGDDLPVPKLAKTSKLGVASTDIGRAIPVDGKLVGSGPLARGMVAPISRAGLSGIDWTAPAVKTGVFVLCALGLGFLIGKKVR